MADDGRVTLEEMTVEVLECHMDGHWWKWTHDDQLVYRGRTLVEFKRWHRCARCRKATRWQLIDAATKTVVRSDRKYDHYLHKGGRLYRADAREEYYKRNPPAKAMRRTRKVA